ncbi:oxidative damage protection protein [Buchnera aphidicola (Neophyllaphis varicolor)]|uniref:oxidative damage protection protein n=1 Tax=Buchnera aphidicola TaxID=9 RepID=UPI0031B87DA7
MKNKIFCKFLKKISKKQENKVYPGKLGDKIFKEISEEAWKIWTLQQTIIINEKQLNMLKREDRQIIENEMINFLFKNKN